MHILGGALYVDVDLWNKKLNDYSMSFLTFDTGVAITTISTDIVAKLGYPLQRCKKKANSDWQWYSICVGGII